MAIHVLRTLGQKVRNPDTIPCPSCNTESPIEMHYPNKVVYRCPACKAAFSNPQKRDAVKKHLKEKQVAAAQIVVRDKSAGAKEEPRKLSQHKDENKKEQEDKICPLIQEAMSRKKILTFQYGDISGVQSVRSVEPYRLILNEKTHEMVLFAFCLEKEAIRSFKLSSISECSVQDFDFNPRWPIEDMTSK